MTLGLVSNCWQVQLAQGASLDELIAEAAEAGFRAIELRQGFLGEYESADRHLPDPAKLEKLPNTFPQMRFNIAIQFPFLSERASSSDELFRAGLWAADSVAGEYPPHLRLVDLTTAVSPQNLPAVEAAAAQLVQLTRELVALDGVLSVENARQPWPWFCKVLDAARDQLGLDRSRLKLCYDPVNLYLTNETIDPLEATKSLATDEISMVHFKQRVDGRIATAVCDGDVNWDKQLAALHDAGYAGPFLFEVASHKKLWEYLAGSREYLRRRGLRP